MRLIILLLFIFSITISCSGPSKKKGKISILKTPRQFETEEDYLRRKALERYRQMRKDAIHNPKKYRRYKTKNRYYGKKRVEIRYVVPKKQVSKEVRSQTPIIMYGELREKLKRRKENREVEIMQNIDFFCIKKQGESDFKNKRDCKAYGLTMLMECEHEIEDGFFRDDHKLIYCIKNKLSL